MIKKTNILLIVIVIFSFSSFVNADYVEYEDVDSTDDYEYRDELTLKEFVIPIQSSSTMMSNGSSNMRTSGNTSVHIKEVTTDPNNSTNYLVKLTVDGSIKGDSDGNKSLHRTTWKLNLNIDGSGVSSDQYSIRKQNDYEYQATRYFLQGRQFVYTIPKSNPVLSFNYDLSAYGLRKYSGGYSGTDTLVYNTNLSLTDFPDVSFTSPIKIRRDSNSVVLNYNAKYNSSIKLTDSFERIIYNGTINSGNGTIEFSKNYFGNGDNYLNIEVTANGWNYTTDDVVNINVDLSGYTYFYAPTKAVNLSTYKIYSPEDATLYLNNFNQTLTTNISNIKTNAVKQISLSEGWNTITLDSSYSNKVYNVYALNSTNVILKKYHFSITKANSFVDVVRSDNRVIIRLTNDVEQIGSESLNTLKQRISVLGDILLEMGSDGKIAADYEVIYADYESDPMKDINYLYVHDPDVFDNNQGFANFNGVNLSSPITNFHKVGLYEMYFQVQDDANSINQTDFTSYDKWSNSILKTILVHRKPFATIDIAYFNNAASGDFDIHEVIMDGYDLDHINEINKGIIETQLEWKSVDDDVWQTISIPTTLSMSTNYNVRYRVRDFEEAWSEWSYNYIEDTRAQELYITTVLDPVYPTYLNYEDTVTVTSTIYSTNTITSVTGSFDGVAVTNMTNISSSGKKSVWRTTFSFPSSKPDGVYNYHTVATTSTSETITDNDLVNVFTPISLVGDVPSTLMVGSSSKITATTSKYVDQVNVTLYNGSGYQVTYVMGKVGTGSWELNHTPEAIPAGNYSAKFSASVATLPRKYETFDDNYTIMSLQINSVNVWGEWNHWRGQVDLFGERKTIEPHRFLSLEKIHINVQTLGEPDEVLIEMSDELESMYYLDFDNNIYSYEDLVGYTVDFPIKMDNGNINSWSLDYILPIAPSTKSIDNTVLSQPYYIKIILKKGPVILEYIVDDIHITGNTIDHVYLQHD